MKERTRSILFIAVFFTICLIPSLGMLVFGPTQPAANEILASPPKLILSDGSFNKELLQDLDDYVTDRFALRQEMVTAWSWTNARLFATSTEEQVVLGSDGWLYYSQTLDDYRGIGLEDNQLEQIAQRLLEIQQHCETKGILFIFTVAPNKNTLFPNHMPSGLLAHAESRNLPRLMGYLEEYGVNHVDLCPILSADERLYYRTDTHWTPEGAALAADALLTAAGRSTNYGGGGFHTDGVYRGDLYEMLYPKGTGTEAQVLFSGTLDYECLSNPNGGNAIKIETRSSSGSGRLLCWRDSFGISLYPYLADSFAEAVFSRSENYDFTKFDGEFDVVIIEIVERNIPRLLENDILFEGEET